MVAPPLQNGSNKINSEGRVGEEALGGAFPFADRDGEVEAGGREAAGGRQATRITSDMAAGSDGSGGRTLRSRASQSSQVHSGRNGPP